MNRFFLIGLLSAALGFVAEGLAQPSFVGNFSGVYLGPSLGLGQTRIGVNNQRYRQTQVMAGGLLGYGQVFATDLYIGGEAGLFHETFSLKKQNQRIENTHQLEGILRFGQVIQYNFLPYVGLGFAHSAYRMRSDIQKKDFYSTDLISEVGVDAFVRPHMVIRSSFRYQTSLSTTGGSSLNVQKKPQSLFIKIGVSYIF